MPEDPDLTRDSPQERALRAAEACREAVADQYATVWQYPPPSATDDLQQVWVLPDGATDWQHVGYTTDPIIGIDYGAADPGESAVITWPHQYGKTAALRSVTLEASLTGDTRGLFDALLVGHRAHLDRRLRRLATDLGRWVPHVRHDFHKVQHVLEEAGIGDGYGRLTIPQPVRPPVEQPAGRWLP
ncbi:hypothetical protein [Streptomyces hirsutus]|uniref:hypothetical protein n=1 Tax=Streptomyces hirsutus TaxID=35620 RepID=UPI0036783FA5